MARVAPLLQLAPNWRRPLVSVIREEELKVLRGHERTGRPLGDEARRPSSVWCPRNPVTCSMMTGTSTEHAPLPTIPICSFYLGEIAAERESQLKKRTSIFFDKRSLDNIEATRPRLNFCWLA